MYYSCIYAPISEKNSKICQDSLSRVEEITTTSHSDLLTHITYDMTHTYIYIQHTFIHTHTYFLRGVYLESFCEYASTLNLAAACSRLSRDNNAKTNLYKWIAGQAETPHHHTVLQSTEKNRVDQKFITDV